MSSGAALEHKEVRRQFGDAGRPLEVLKGVNFSLRPGEVVALVGPSGAGKSTLLHIAGLLEAPSSGQVLVDGVECSDLNDTRRTELRRKSIGFVYQFHHLLPEFSARENVVVPQMINGLSRHVAEQRADQLLSLVGLADRAAHRPGQLSGGEQQRVAIVRGIANVPRVLLADEPTGNLDPSTADEVFEQLTKIVKASELSALIATHNFDLARRMDRVLELRDGVVREVEV